MNKACLTTGYFAPALGLANANSQQLLFSPLAFYILMAGLFYLDFLSILIPSDISLSWRERFCPPFALGRALSLRPSVQYVFTSLNLMTMSKKAR